MSDSNASPIDLRPDHLATVRTILKSYIPGREVRVYGSRAKWSAHDNSDLDLVVLGNVRLDTVVLGSLHSAFEESNLPFRVDIFDWNTLPENFHSEIERAYSVVATESTCPGWSEYSIRKYAPLKYGKALPSRSRNIDGEYPVYGSNGIIGYHDEAVTEGPTVIVGRKGTAGAVHFSPIPCWPIDTTFYHEEEDTELALFKSYILSTLGLDRMNSDSAVPGLNRDVAHAVRIRIPPTSEQRRIADVLGSLDDRIELNRRMCGTLEDMASTLFKAWFVDFEPVRAKIEGRWREGESLPGLPAHLYDLFPDGLVDSELGPVPYRWPIVPMGEMATTVYGAPFASTLFNDDQLGNPLIRIRDLATGNPSKWTKETHAKGHLVQPGEIVAGMDGEFRSYYWKGRSAWLNQRVCSFLPHSGISKVFLRETVEGLLRIEERSKEGTTVRHLGKSDIDKFKVVRPPSPVMERFQSMADALINNSVAQSQQTQLLGLARDTLLPKLISGEVRLPDAAGETDC